MVNNSDELYGIKEKRYGLLIKLIVGLTWQNIKLIARGEFNVSVGEKTSFLILSVHGTRS